MAVQAKPDNIESQSLDLLGQDERDAVMEALHAALGEHPAHLSRSAGRSSGTCGAPLWLRVYRRELASTRCGTTKPVS